MNKKLIKVNGYVCELSLVDGLIKENDFVISIHRFIEMDNDGVYRPTGYKHFDVMVEKAILINIGTDYKPEIVLGLDGGGCCGKALQAMYSLVEVEFIK